MSDSINRDSPPYGWLTLALAPGIGPASRRRLVDHFGSLDAILSADAEALRDVVSEARAAALASPGSTRSASGTSSGRWPGPGPRSTTC